MEAQFDCRSLNLERKHWKNPSSSTLNEVREIVRALFYGFCHNSFYLFAVYDQKKTTTRKRRNRPSICAPFHPSASLPRDRHSYCCWSLTTDSLSSSSTKEYWIERNTSRMWTKSSFNPISTISTSLVFRGKSVSSARLLLRNRIYFASPFVSIRRKCVAELGSRRRCPEVTTVLGWPLT